VVRQLLELKFLLVVDLLREPPLLVHALDASPIGAQILVHGASEVPVVVDVLQLLNDAGV